MIDLVLYGLIAVCGAISIWSFGQWRYHSGRVSGLREAQRIWDRTVGQALRDAGIAVPPEPKP